MLVLFTLHPLLWLMTEKRKLCEEEILERLDGNCREGRLVQTILESQQPIPVRRCVSTNDEVRKNSARTWIALLTARSA